MAHPTAPAAGDLLDRRYRLEHVIARGGVGTVWAARDERLARPVAVKVPHRDLPAGVVDRARTEALAAARVDDPRVVSVLDLVADADGRPVIVLERHDGTTLADVLRDGPLPPEDLAGLVDDLTGALAAAHAVGVLHRDVKPSNVLRGRQGWCTTDFGLASLGDDGTDETPMATLAYAPAERLAGARGDERSDVFAAAVVLVEAATGQHPFRAGTTEASAARIRADDHDPLPPALPDRARATLEAALAHDPRRRPASIAALRVGLGELVESPPSPATDATVPLDATAVLPAAAGAGTGAAPGPVTGEPRTARPVGAAPAGAPPTGALPAGAAPAPAARTLDPSVATAAVATRFRAGRAALRRAFPDRGPRLVVVGCAALAALALLVGLLDVGSRPAPEVDPAGASTEPVATTASTTATTTTPTTADAADTGPDAPPGKAKGRKKG